jgi:hypothetical protein
MVAGKGGSDVSLWLGARSAARIASVVAALLLTTTFTSAARAAEPCDSQPERAAVRPVADPALAAELAEPFRYLPTRLDRQAVLAEVVQVVRAQAVEGAAGTCYQAKPDRIATRVDFLSPFEFLVMTLFDQDPARRDALLDRYVTDPQGAVKGLGDVFPSTRAQAALAAYAYYDIASDRIRVNTAKVPPDELRRVLVHEFWHAMPRSRTWTEPDGRTLRASGFWLQERQPGRRLWMPVDDRRGLPYASYLLDEGMAALMETRYAGPSRFARSDLVDVQRFLERLMAVAGSQAVLREYLESQPYELSALTEAHRSSFPELELVARP